MTQIRRERPMLFSGPMIHPILDDRKTQTRRIIAPRDLAFALNQDLFRYGEPGDRLWVKETFYCDDYRAQVAGVKPDDGMLRDFLRPDVMFYRADGEPHFEANEGGFWKPSIFMPRWASRIDLEITKIRIEQLNEITENDARAEGVSERWDRTGRFVCASAVHEYSVLWDKINGARAAWASNPLVWVVEFWRIRP